MNISYKWLKDYLDIDLEPAAVADDLTSIGLETGSVERVESIRGGLRGIVVGKVLTCVEHPDSDHLHITTVDLGDGQPTQIVCGAPNVAAGQTVVVATVGTTLYDGDKEFKIKKSKIRGVESSGMICAEDEIGVGSSHDGIMVLDDSVKAGTPAAEYFGLTDDYVLEVDLTPNRIDAASHYGVARDLAAFLACHEPATAPRLKRPSAEGFSIDDPAGKGVEVTVEAPEACTRYCGLTIEGVRVAESPDWLKDRLNVIGLRPINNVVDITNYILHAFGQPLHAFDRARIGGDRIVVRKAAGGDKFTTLDGVERTLDAADLMICDACSPMCIAGVFGGLDSGVTEATTSVFLESACFNPTSVRKTARRHGLSTDSSFRFERGVDPDTCRLYLEIAANMIREIAGGKILGDVVDIYPTPAEPAKVELSYGTVTRLLGQEIPSATIDSILQSLEIGITGRSDADGGTLTLAVPTYRVDVTRPCDVIEDILRIYGYNNIAIPTALHASLSFKTPTDAADDLRRTLANCLTGAGYTEILNNSLTAKAYYEPLTAYPADACVELLNPLSQDLNVMRQTLLFGGLESLAHNINRRSADLAMYETGNVYARRSGEEPTDAMPLKPYHEHSRIALWLTGRRRPASWDRPAEDTSFFDLKATVGLILTRCGLDSRMYTVRTPDTVPDIYSTALVIESRNGKPLGAMGIVAADILRRLDIKQPVYFAELDLQALTDMAAKAVTTFRPLPKTQAVKRDLSLLIDNATTMADVERVIRQSDKKLLRDVALFDVYEGKGLPEGKKSYAVTITLRDDEKTLSDNVTDAVMNKIIAALRKQLGAELR